MWDKKKRPKSPLREQPLRHAGQSLQDEINRVLDEKVFFDLTFVTAIIVVTGFQWYLYFYPQTKPPIAVTILTAVICTFLIFRMLRSLRAVKQLKLGRHGERIVAEVLEELRVRGFGVLHDVPGDKFNLDHVVFSPHGIYVVETKTINKPAPDAQVNYDGTRVLVAGRQPTRDPIIQVKSAARWLQEMLKASTGKAFPVRGVVVYPGWYVESRAGNKAEVWVLNPKALADFIIHQPQLLQPDDVQMALFHVSRISRTG
ncbi:MAG: NERD domain-containing protein [Anaerolineales bacterium]|nr:MAG: NERD domain-containing protein [Anaerolineales bacterium]